MQSKGNRIRKSAKFRVMVLCALIFALFAFPAMVAAAEAPLAQGWNLIAMPAPPDAAAAASLNLEFFSVSGGAYTAVSPGDVTPGYGYWVYAPSAGALPFSDSEPATEYTIHLTRGWNAVGNPFGEAVAWGGNVRVATRLGQVPIAESGAVSGGLIQFNSSTGQYEQIVQNAQLEPFRAYLIRANEDCDIVINLQGSGGGEPVVEPISTLPFDEGAVTTDPGTGRAIVADQVVVSVSGVSLSAAAVAIESAGGEVVGYNAALGLVQVRIPAGAEPAAFAQTLDASGAVADAATVPVFEQAALPDDPIFTDSDSSNDFHFTAINATAAWDALGPAPPQPVVIAILDTGVNAGHEELSGRVLPGKNFADGGEDTTDRNGHGTMAAGLAAGAGNNARGAAGLCWDCRVLPVKVLADNGQTSVFTVITGIIYAADNGAKIINLSLSGPTDNGFWEEQFIRAVNYANAKGAVVVGAAGNRGEDAGAYLPAAASRVITVAAVDATGARAAFSNYGSYIDMAAPGARVYANNLSDYEKWSGTSVSAPLVSGAAALLAREHPEWTPSQIEQALVTTARPVQPVQPIGAGVLDVAAALAADPAGGSSGGGTVDPGGGSGGGSDPGMGAAATCSVTNALDTGAGSLRNCITFANANPGSTINFTISNTYISLASALPAITAANTIIDGTGRNVIVGGDYLGFDGFRLQSNNITIKGLALVRFYTNAADVAAVRMTGAASNNNHIYGCRIGTNFSDNGNYYNRHGVIIEGGAHDNEIGDGTTGNRNIISGNADSLDSSLQNGVWIKDSPDNDILGNYIGITSSGAALLRNDGNGVLIEGAASLRNNVGDVVIFGYGNVISGNVGNGILIRGAGFTEVYNNIIGLGANGAMPLANDGQGVKLEGGANNNIIGGTADLQRNIISNNTNGIYITGAGTNDNQIYNNYIGTDITGLIGIFNRASGVYFDNGTRNKIGGTAPFQGNIISGNHGFGVLMNSANTINNTVQGNYIGISKDGSSLPNTESGVGIISGPTGNTIGSRIVAESGENIIAHNLKDGIRVMGNTSVNNLFFKNSIYTNTLLGIDLGANGVTPNGSGPVGPNNYIDYPAITGIVPRGGGCYDFSGTKAANSYAVIYKADYPAGSIDPDPSGRGEGYAFVAVSSSAYAGTSFAFSNLCIAGATTVTFLAYDSNGNTSEFGRNFSLTALPIVTNVQFTSNPIIANGFRKTVVTADISYDNGLTFMQGVTANLSPVGGGVVTTMYDDGAHNDGAANDGKYGSDPFAADEGTAGPSQTITVTAMDKINTAGTGNGTLNITTLDTPQACGSDWTSFACDSANRGVSTQVFSYPLTQKWAQTTLSWPVYTSAAVSGNYVITAESGDALGGTQRGKIRGLNKSTGGIAWTYTPPVSDEYFMDSTPAVWNTSVFVVGTSGSMYSLNASTGGQNWIFNPGMGTIRGGSPVVAHDMVFVGTEAGMFYGLNASTGGVVWSFPSTMGASFEDQPAAVVNGVVYVADYAGMNARHVYALDAFTGQKYWENTFVCTGCGIAGSGTAVSGDLVCSGAHSFTNSGGNSLSHVFCLDKYTGTQKWMTPTPLDTTIYDNHGVFFGGNFIIGHYAYNGGTSALRAYNTTTGAAAWTFTPDAGIHFRHSSPVIIGSTLYVTAGDKNTNKGYLYALNASTGAKLWSQSFPYDMIANPAITDNLLILGTTNNSVIALEPGSDPCPGFAVTSNADSGNGTLRACIDKANGTPAADTITFNITNTTITPTDTYTITATGGPLTINAQGKNIVIDGSLCTLCEGFDVLADGVTINGLAMVRYPGNGHHAISIEADNTTVTNCRIGTNWSDASGLGNYGGIYLEGSGALIKSNVISGSAGVGLTLAGTDTASNIIRNNYIGVKSDGATALGNATGGILITNGAHDNTVGGALASDANVLSGNTTGYGIQIYGNGSGSNNNIIQGNYVGTNASGNAAVPNTTGVYLNSVVDNTQIGGLYGTYGNIISGNSGQGIFIFNTTNTFIYGNIIGLNKTGAAVLPNGGKGIDISSTNGCAIGKNSSGYGNIISGNLDHGIFIVNSVTNCTIHDNMIGLKADGVTAAGNVGDGVRLGSNTTSAVIGDIAGNENIIAYNGGSGIFVNLSTSPIYEFRGNRIYGNTGMGIVSSLTYNLAVNTITINGSNYDVSGTSACANCRVELYRVDDTASGIGQDNATVPPAGEGFQFLGEKTTDAGGAWSFTNIAISGGGYVTALIIDTTNKTTKFAPNKALPVADPCPGNTVTSAANSGDGTLRACIEKANGTPGAETITFTISNTTISPTTTYTVQAAGGDLIIDGAGRNIVIDGASCAGCDGFTALADDFQIKGVAVTRFNGAGKYGVKVTANNAVIQGNRIGTNFSDAAALGNAGGIYVQGANCYVISNIVAGNAGVGVTLDGAATNGCDVEGNYVGLKSDGATALANGAGGILVQGGAHDNVIGGEISLNEGNVISGQGAAAYGISITGAGSTGNMVWGNVIGLNAAGTAALPNKHGVQVFSGAHDTIIGGVRASHGNIISGNTNTGVNIQNSNNVTVSGNLIGLNKAGNAKIGNNIGVYASGANTCRIGTTVAGQENYIGGNNSYGVMIAGASGCSVLSARIGLQTDNVSAAGNTGSGVYVSGASSNITIGNITGAGNIITFSGGHGVEIAGAPPGVVVSGNSIFNNAGRGILSATNYNLAITAVAPNGLNYDISGTSICAGCKVQLYQVDYPSNGIMRDNATTPPAGEGYKYLGEKTTTAGGAWSFTSVTVTGGNFVTALIIDASNNTTEFAPDRWLGGDAAACGADWPSFHCNFHREARNTNTVATPLSKKWEYQTGDYIISSPAVSGGRVYVGSADYKVYAFDAVTGAKIWESTAPTHMANGSPTVGPNYVYVGSQDDKLYALRLSDGVKQWEFPTGGDVAASPVLAGGKLIFGSYDNKVYALNPDTGAKYWEYVTSGSVIMSPAVYDGNVYAGSWDGKVYALDIDTGTKLWEYNIGGGIFGAPAAVGGVVYISSTNDRVYALNAYTGAWIWTFTATGDVRSSPAVGYGNVYVGAWDNKVYAINATTGLQSWAFPTGGVVDASPALADNKVFITSDDGKMYVLDAITGAKLDEYTTGGWSRSSPAVAGGMVYFGSFDKKLHALGPHQCPGYVVTTTADSGTGSLRACLLEAKSAPGSTITFAAGIANGTIKPQTELPTVTANNTIIDGAARNITLDGSFPCNNCHGLVLQGTGGTVKNLTIVNFSTATRSGIVIDGGSGGGKNYTITGCKLGTDGTVKKPNDYGVSIVSGGQGNTIGGTTAAEFNTIAGNNAQGVSITGVNTAVNTVKNNYIGTNAAGAATLGNALAGVRIGNSAASNTVTSDSGLTQVIAFNGQAGVRVESAASDNNRILTNKIHSNTGVGIDLDGAGANNNMAAPGIAAPTLVSPGVYDISGTSACGAGCTVQLFRVDDTASGIGQDNASVPPAGEAFAYLNVATTGAGGAWSFPNQAVSGGQYITATITDGSGNTSEFAVNKQLPVDLCPGFTVTTNADSGVGSLRECINKTNGTPGAETITFTISNTTISPTSTYTIQAAGGPLTIDGTGKNILIDGAWCATGDGFTVQADGFTLKGLALTSFQGGGKYTIKVTANNAVIQGNRIGTNWAETSGFANSNGVYVEGQGALIKNNVVSGNVAWGVTLSGAATYGCEIKGNYIGLKSDGVTALGNYIGIYVINGAHNNFIGGSIALGEGNVISGNFYGIFLVGSGSTGSEIQGNLIGTTAAGTAALPNGTGIVVQSGADDTYIGGTRADHGNIISGNTSDGIAYYNANNVTIAGNIIGLNKAGNGIIANGRGVYVLNGNGGKIGSTIAGQENYISGNNGNGLHLETTMNCSVLSTIIGLKTDNVTSAGNTGNGILLSSGATNTTIGDTSGHGNIIAYNGGRGIYLIGAATDFNKILSNRIYSNTLLGIDLDGAGANNNIAAPTIAAPTLVSPGVYNISGTTTCAGACKVQLFRVDDTASGIGQDNSVPPSGEAFAFIAEVNSVAGAWSFPNQAVSGGQYITATVTDTTNNTSEFAINKQLPVDMCAGFVVSTLANSGSGSLRECMLKANSEPTNDVITFSVSGTITPLSELPTLTDNQTTINGGGNITLDGNLANFNGIVIQSNNNVIRDMTIIRFEGAGKAGILIDGGDNNTIYGCKIGNDGTIQRKNYYGVLLKNGATWNTIGGNTPAKRNIISGNTTGVYITGATTERNKIAGNYIGLNAAGTGALGNTTSGILIEAPRNTVGGGAGEGNVISGNPGANGGVYVSTVNAQSTEIKGNYIGTNAAGTAAVSNSWGIRIVSGANNTTIGGPTDADRNVISGNNGSGITIDASSYNNVIGNYIGTSANGLAPLQNDIAGVSIGNGSTNNYIGGPNAATRNIIAAATQWGVYIGSSSQNQIQGNYIGVDKNGQRMAGMGNLLDGIYIDSGNDNKIGGSGAGQSPNIIAQSGNRGIWVRVGTLNTISQNVIYGNGGLGIDLDSGGNANIAAPTITYARYTSPGVADISGTSVCGSGCTVELYRADDTGAGIVGDAAGGEGFAYLGTATTGVGGAWSFTGVTFTGGDYVTATISGTTGNTSEFAANRKVVFNSPPVITLTTSSSYDISIGEVITLNATANDPDGDPLTYTWSGGGASPFTATNTASTQWTGPVDAFIASITITVSDPSGATASALIPVRVGIKDVYNLNCHPRELSIPAGSSYDFTCAAQLSTGHHLVNIHSEAAIAKQGLGTVDVYGHFTAVTPGSEELLFRLGDYSVTVPVTIY